MSDIDYIALTKLCTHCQFQQVMYNSNDAFISIPIFDLYLYRDASNNEGTGLFIGVTGSANTKAKVIVKGKVTLNSNGEYGMYSFLNTNTNLEINVENGRSTLETCGNGDEDIGGNVPATASATFSGTGYTCDQAKVQFFDSDGGGTVGTVVPPVCQACPSPSP